MTIAWWSCGHTDLLGILQFFLWHETTSLEYCAFYLFHDHKYVGTHWLLHNVTRLFPVIYTQCCTLCYTHIHLYISWMRTYMYLMQTSVFLILSGNFKWLNSTMTYCFIVLLLLKSVIALLLSKSEIACCYSHLWINVLYWK